MTTFSQGWWKGSAFRGDRMQVLESKTFKASLWKTKMLREDLNPKPFPCLNPPHRSGNRPCFQESHLGKVPNSLSQIHLTYAYDIYLQVFQRSRPNWWGFKSTTNFQCPLSTCHHQGEVLAKCLSIEAQLGRRHNEEHLNKEFNPNISASNNGDSVDILMIALRFQPLLYRSNLKCQNHGAICQTLQCGLYRRNPATEVISTSKMGSSKKSLWGNGSWLWCGGWDRNVGLHLRTL